MTHKEFCKEWHRGSRVKIFGITIKVMGIHFGKELIAFDFGPIRIWLHREYFKLINNKS